MPSLLANFEYDIFISYRHNDNRSGWVTEFVNALQEELAATIKEPLSIYFDKNPHDGLQQHHEVDESLRLKLKSLVLIPIVSQTYCDTKSFAWEHELLPFIQQATNDSLGLKTKVSGGNIANRVLPVKIHDIDNDDKHLFEEATGSALRSIDFIYKESGVNRPLRPADDRDRNQEKIDYLNQVNKVANAIKEIISGLRNQQGNTPGQQPSIAVEVPVVKHKPKSIINWKSKIPTIPIFRLSLVSILLAVGLFVISYLHFGEEEVDVQTIRSAISPAEGTRYWESSGSNYELSPDGKHLAYVGIDSVGNSLIWVRSLNSLTSQALTGTETATLPFWSPDSRFIGFFANGKLKKIPAAGGPVQNLCDAIFGRGGTWNQDGTIVFCPNINQALFKVSSSGGTPIAVTKLDSAQDHKSHRYPYFLSDGQHFIYLARTAIAADGLKDAVYVGSLDSTFTPRLIAPVKTSTAYANGQLLFLQGQTLMAQSFDTRSLQTTGDPLPVAEHVGYVPVSAKASYSVSQNGLLVYMIGAGNYERNLVWRDRNSNELATIQRNENYIEYRISPDEKKLIVSMTVSNSNVGDTDLWLYEIDRNTWTRFTFDATTPQRWPIWSPDGNTIMYSSVYKGIYTLFMRPSNGSSAEKLVLETNDIKKPMDWSTDGKYVIYEVSKNGQDDLWILPMDGQQAGKPFPFLETPFGENRPAFSPDGRWVSYASDESGRWEVYIRPFPGPGGKWQLSTNGGTYSRWSVDEKEIFYFNPYVDNYIRAAEIKISANAIEIGETKKLLQFNITSGLNYGYFDVNGKGDRFLFREGQNDADNTPLTLVTNWPEEIKKK